LPELLVEIYTNSPQLNSSDAVNFRLGSGQGTPFHATTDVFIQFIPAAAALAFHSFFSQQGSAKHTL
jgi:hypothetical protein